MRKNEQRGWLQSAWSAFRRSLLGKSDPAYLDQLAGDGRYWNEAIAAEYRAAHRRPTLIPDESEYITNG